MWLLGPVEKDARRKIMNLGGTETFRSLTATQLVEKMMSWLFGVLSRNHPSPTPHKQAVSNPPPTPDPHPIIIRCRVGVAREWLPYIRYLQAAASAADLWDSIFGCLEAWSPWCALDVIDLNGFNWFINNNVMDLNRCCCFYVTLNTFTLIWHGFGWIHVDPNGFTWI